MFEKIKISQPKLFLSVILFILVLGTCVRFVDLQWHFSHPDDAGVAKTILKSKNAGNFDLFAVPNYWNYAPFQFFFTHYLIQPEDTYRDYLFWGRFPSAVFNSLGLLFCLGLYFLLDRFRSYRVVFALALVAFSFENIIHSKQMHNYGIGVPAAILLLMLFLYHLNRNQFTLKEMVVGALGLALLSHMQYQILFFVPAFYAALFLFACLQKQRVLIALRNLIFGGMSYLGMILPMLYFFLLKRADHGAHWWTRGVHNEFWYHPLARWSLWEKIEYTFEFFLRNFFITYDANIAFLREGNSLFEIVLFCLSLLCVIGFISMFFDRDNRFKAIAWFFMFLMLTWSFLVVTEKINFAPSRHELILLPILIVLTVEGVAFLLDIVQQNLKTFDITPIQKYVYLGLSLGVLVLFLLSHGKFLDERRDVFIETEVLDILKEYDVDTVLILRDTAQVHLMKSVDEYLAKKHGPEEGLKTRLHPYRSMAWISRIAKYNDVKLKELEEFHNRLLWQHYSQIPRVEGSPHPLDKFPYRYKVIFKKEIESDVEIDFSKKTKNGTNSLYFYILQRDIYP